MLTRSTFKKPVYERQRTVHTPIPERLRRAASFAKADQMAAPQHKPEVHRNAALLEMARDRRCVLMLPDLCRGHDTSTTVAAHSNWSDHGKAGARKADDTYVVFACHACHQWLDQGPATADEKRATFDAAHARQVQEWARIAADPKEPPRFRKAADWALNLLMRKP